ncbi:MAG: nicotinate-nicotinamide nucleotide adenylyltransferase, partial [Actinomycetes bacterium]
MDGADGAKRPDLAEGRRIGVFGGTFDPPHIGHLVPALDVVEALHLDELVLMVAADPWQKRQQVVAAAADRLAMVDAAVRDLPRVVAGRSEIDRGGVTYTIDTLV